MGLSLIRDFLHVAWLFNWPSLVCQVAAPVSRSYSFKVSLYLPHQVAVIAHILDPPETSVKAI